MMSGQAIADADAASKGGPGISNKKPGHANATTQQRAWAIMRVRNSSSGRDRAILTQRQQCGVLLDRKPTLAAHMIAGQIEQASVLPADRGWGRETGSGQPVTGSGRRWPNRLGRLRAPGHRPKALGFPRPSPHPACKCPSQWSIMSITDDLGGPHAVERGRSQTAAVAGDP